MQGEIYPTGLLDRHRQIRDASSDSGGRTPFERDRDRILYSSAFRALANKTQVVAATELGYLHNRLTHSLKVAQVGRSLASRLRREGHGVDPALVEAGCLAHDIGHPPFGHAGEDALSKAVDKLRRDELGLKSGEEPTAPLDGFEGNAQNLRVLTRLATHSDWQEPGLHLTRAALAATMKYPWLRAASGPRAEKWGAYSGDQEALEWVLEGRPADGPEKPIETRIMDWADDVTYAVHDVEDWYRQGLIPLDRLFLFERSPEHPRAGREESADLGEFLDWVLTKWQDPDRRKYEDLDRETLVLELHRLKDRIHVESPFEATRRGKGLLQATVSDLISYLGDKVTVEGPGIAYDGDLIIPDDRRLICDLLKELVWYYVIGRRALAAQQHGQARIITDLVTWIHREHPTNDRLLPKDRKAELEQHGDLTRAVADHVASLTEPMAIMLHGKLSGSNLGWVTDTI